MKVLHHSRLNKTGTWLVASICLLGIGSAIAQRNRISGPIDHYKTAIVPGHVLPIARSEFDRGPVAPNFVMHGMTLAVRRTAAQQKDLNQLLAAQQNAASPQYHKWLTPEQFADRFGASPSDLLTLRQWLEGKGFQIKAVARSRNFIRFDGTAAQVNSAFATELHHYAVNGVQHFANASEPSLPANLAPMVLGIGGLNDFGPHPNHVAAPASNSKLKAHALDGGDNIYLAPSDLAAIYDMGALQTAASMGSGQTVVVVGTSDITGADLTAYCTNNSLSCGTFTSTFPAGDGDPGPGPGAFEATMDLELVSAVAPAANLVLDADSNAWNALSDAVTNDAGKVVLMSYGQCEATVGSAQAAIIEGYVQQANLQGQTVIAASGNNGAADCDLGVTSATQGLAVDLPASIPEVTGVGGTEFSDQSSTYWTAGVPSGYVPEEAWNDTGYSVTLEYPSFAASGGGVSSFFTATPSFQASTAGVLGGGRNVPDVAMAASPFTDYYQLVMTMGETQQTIGTGGTAASASVFAGIVALMNQAQAASGLGNINPQLYTLAAGNNGSSAFHDITTGNNYVPCTAGSTDCPASAPYQIGYAAAVGYDQVTGLGSVDASNLNSAWTAPTITNLSPNAATAGSSGVPVIITGTGFSAGSTVTWTMGETTSTIPEATCASSPCSVTIPAADLASAGAATVQVVNASSVSSNPAAFTVNAAPEITSITGWATAGNSSPVTLTLNGSGLISTASVKWQMWSTHTAASSLSWASCPSTPAASCTVTVPSANLTTAGTAYITVVTSDGISSNSQSFPIAGAPAISWVTPHTATAGNTAGVPVTITGSNFASGYAVMWNGTTTLSSSFSSATSMSATVAAAQLASAGSDNITVVTPDGVSSGNFGFSVVAAPAITSLSPSSAIAGTSDPVLVTITGSGFTSTSVVKWNTQTVTSYYGSATSMVASIPASYLASAGSAQIYVVSGDGLSSSGSAFTINGMPVIASLTPSTIPAGSISQQVVIAGTGFASTSVVKWNSTTLSPVTYSSSNHTLTVTVPAADLLTAGNNTISVANNGVTSVASANSTFAVSPVISSLSPSSAPAGSSQAVSLNIAGNGFTTLSVVVWKGRNSPLSGSSCSSATACTATVPASYLATAGLASVQVRTADGVSSVVNSASEFSIASASITGFNPASATAGSNEFALAVNGTGFQPGAQILWWNQNAHPAAFVPVTTAFEGATQLTGSILASQIPASATTVPVAVLNADGTTSVPANFAIVAAAAPVISSLTPSSAVAGVATAVVIKGTGFIAGTSSGSGASKGGSTVLLDNQSTGITYSALGTATQISISIAASSLVTAGNHTITVVSNGVTSAPATFTVVGPTITSTTPASIAAGTSTPPTLVVTGVNFIAGTSSGSGSSKTYTAGSAVWFSFDGGTPVQANYTALGTTTSITTTVPASLLSSSGTMTVTVMNTAGGASVASAPYSVGIVAPTISSLSATSIPSGSAAFSLLVSGTNFVASGSNASKVYWGSTALTTTINAAGTQLTAAVPAASLQTAGNYTISVQNGSAATSAATTFQVLAPTIASNGGLSATSAAADTTFTLTVTGTNFIVGSKTVTGSAVIFTSTGGTPTATALATVSATSTSIKATVPATLAAGAYLVTVANPGLSSGSYASPASNAVPFTAGTLIPSSAPAGSGSFTLTVNGTGFTSASKVTWGTGSSAPQLATTYVSTTQLTATVPSADVAASGAVTVGVTKGTLTGATFTVSAPTITLLAPNSAVAGSTTGPTVLAVTGTNFISGVSTVYWGSTALTTMFVSSTSLTATITSAQLLAAGPVNITVRNGSSSAASTAAVFTVNGPTITSLSTTTAVAGAAGFTLTVSGSNFVAGSTVIWDSTPLTTGYVDATTLHATVTSGVLTTGSHSVTVQNTSSATTVTPSSVTFTVTAP